VNGIHSLRNVPKDTIDDSAFFCDCDVLDLIRSFCAPRRRMTVKVFKVHLDSANPQNSPSREFLKQIHTIRAVHPIFSLGSASSKFFLFEYLK
jgi:hypothetical protein